MRRSLVLSTQAWTPLPALAARAEALGFARLWTTEGPRRDALVRAAALLSSTSRIEVGTGIALAFARSPLALAGAACDLALISGGRFTLGLGAGTRGVRRQYGVPDIDKPAPWFEELVQLLRFGTSGTAQAIAFEGSYFKIRLGEARLAGSALLPASPPIYGAAINPIMTKRVAACCDGLALLSIGLGRAYLENVIAPAFRKGRERAGKPAQGGFACWCITAVDPDRERARMMARRQLAFYFSTPSYWAPAREMGEHHVLAKLQEAFKASAAPNWKQLAELISDAMVDEFALAGTPAEVREKLALLEGRLAPLGVDELAFQLPSATGLNDGEVERLSQHMLDVCAPGGAGA